MNQTIIFQPCFQTYPIQANPDLNQGCLTAILDRLLHLMNTMTEDHCKVLFIRFDIRFPNNYFPPSDNSIFQRFFENFIRHLQRQVLDPHYLWVREQSKEKHQHYHVVLLLDGNKTQSIYGHLNLAESLWAKSLGLPDASGLICYCTESRDGIAQHNGLMMRRGSPDFPLVFNTCFEWASYLAKINTKGNAPNGVREWGSSQL